MKRMTLTKQLCASVLLSAVAVTTAHAQEGILEGWSGTASISANAFSGNSEASNAGAEIRLGKTVGRWEHVVFGNYFAGDATVLVDALDANGLPITQTIDGEQVVVQRAESAGTSNRISVGYTPRFYWLENTYLFGLLDFSRDRPANLDLSSRQLIGIGHRFFASSAGFLTAEAGIGNNTQEQVIGPELSGGVLYLGANYLNRVTDNITFNADFRADVGEENTYTEINLGLALKVSERLSVKLSHQTRGNTDIENPTLASPSSSDSATSLSLAFDI